MIKKNSKISALIMEQLKDVEGCLINFENFMRAATTKGVANETLRALASGVQQMEGAADRSLSAMIESLAKVAFLPATREDLITLATSCDRIANKCEHTSMMMVRQHFVFPEKYNERIMEIMKNTRAEFELLEKSIDKLFSDLGGLLKDHSILHEIRDEESKVDVIEEDLYEEIFALDMPLAEKTQMATFVEWLCDLSDIIENIADTIQIMLITRKA